MVVPMPTAGPHTAAITGLGKAARPRKKRNTGESWVAGDFTLKFGQFALGGIGTATFGAILLYALLNRKAA